MRVLSNSKVKAMLICTPISLLIITFENEKLLIFKLLLLIRTFH